MRISFVSYLSREKQNNKNNNKEQGEEIKKNNLYGKVGYEASQRKLKHSK